MGASGRPRLALGELGDISFTEVKNKAGKVTGYRARGRWRRPTDGVILPKEKTGPSQGAAKSALKKHIDELNRGAGGGSVLITPDTLIPDLADAWIVECEADEGIADGSVLTYRRHIEPAEVRFRRDGEPLARKRADGLKVKVAFANVTVRELTTPVYVAHEANLLAAGLKPTAKLHRVIMRGMMNMAIRHGAVTPGQNPIVGLKPIRYSPGRPRALSKRELSELLTQVHAWQQGRPSDEDLMRVIRVLLGTGARIGEVLGLRRCDVHRPQDVDGPWIVDIFGTVISDKKLGTFRRPHTKTGEDGNRSVVLPRFAVLALREIGADGWDGGDESPVFPDGGGVWRPTHKVRTRWDLARGEEFAWVQLRTFRKTVATIIAREYGAAQAGLQLGHVPGSKVTEVNYIERLLLAPDSTLALERFAESDG